MPTIVFLSTYPPRECGIATFTQDLLRSCQQFLGSSVRCKVAALNITSLDTHKYPSEVSWQIDQNSTKSFIDFAHSINKDISISGVIIQHEYGIFGGEEGKNILTFMQNCTKPLLVTLHTVLPEPNILMHEVTSKIIDLATTLVVLTARSKEIVELVYPSSLGKVFVIPHGIHAIPFSDSEEAKKKLELEEHTILSTFGLLSIGKGIEYVIQALPEVIKKHPSLLYLVLGQTHPVVVRNEGEHYRIKLLKLITDLRLEDHVKFYNQYMTLPELFKFLKATDIYISTSINPHQAVSGTLSYAMGAGRAVISTQFAQSKEIVSPDIGRLVPVKDSTALASAILDLLSDVPRLQRMNLNAYQTTRPMVWRKVAEKYIGLLNRIIIPELDIKHLHTMTDEFGLLQFASLAVPNYDFGYTIDDNARALILCSWLTQQKNTKELETLIIIYLAFIKKCQDNSGNFINYIEYQEKNASIQNTQEDLQDAEARTMWALAEVLSNKILPAKIRNQAKTMFLLKFTSLPVLTHHRSKAFMTKAFALAQEVLIEQRSQLLEYIRIYSDTLVEALKDNTEKSWHWFEDHLSYNNGLLSESLLIAGQLLDSPIYAEKGYSSLQFLIGKTFSENKYLPIGQSYWYRNNEKRSEYDQQPEDPAAMILALNRAYICTGDVEYKYLAKQCFSWFLGQNSLNTTLYDKLSGGCFDGLRPEGVNLNQGAESLVSYLMSNFTVRELH